jgi:hypothetical protein
MRAISRRLDRLEKLGLVVETGLTRHWRVRLDAARLRSGSPPVPWERRTGLRGMSVTAILNSSRAASLRPVDAVRDLLKHSPLLIPVDLANDGP